MALAYAQYVICNGNGVSPAADQAVGTGDCVLPIQYGREYSFQRVGVVNLHLFRQFPLIARLYAFQIDARGPGLKRAVNRLFDFQQKAVCVGFCMDPPVHENADPL